MPDDADKALADLQVINWPDPRLKKVSAPVREFNDSLRQLADRMLELMREHKGVGLAAPQVGRNIRLFVMNATGEPDQDRVYVNPVLSDPEGEDEGEEGCLSLPGIHTHVMRHKKMKLTAVDLAGNPIEEAQSDFAARIWQHEYDHLNGVLLIDRMGPAARIAARKTLRELEDKYGK